MNYQQSQQRDFRNYNGNGNRMINYYSLNNMQSGVQQYPNYLQNSQYDQQNTFFIQQPDHIKPVIQAVNRNQISQNRYNDQDKQQLDIPQINLTQGRLVGFEGSNQQERMMMIHSSNHNRFREINGNQQVDRLQQNFNQNRFLDIEGIKSSIQNNSFAHRFINNDGSKQLIQSNSLQSRFIEVEDEDDSNDSKDISNDEIEEEDIDDDIIIEQSNNQANIADIDDQNDDIEDDEYNCINYKQNVKKPFNQIRSQGGLSQHNTIQKNFQSSLSNFQQNKINNGISSINNNNISLRQTPITNYLNNIQNQQNQIQQQINNSQINKQCLVKNEIIMVPQQKVSAQQPLRAQILQSENIEIRQLALDSESTTDDEHITEIERVKLGVEQNSERFSEDNRHKYIKQEVKDYEKQGKLLKYYRNKEKYLRKISSDDYKKACSYEEERILKGNEKTFSYKKLLHKELREDQDKYSNHALMKGTINLIANMRRYEEDGNLYTEKIKILTLNQQKQKKIRPPHQDILLKSQTPSKKRKIDESLIVISGGEDTKEIKDIKIDQNENQNSNNDYRDDDEYDEESAQNNQENKKSNKKQSKPKQQKIKLPCYCQENKEDELRLCYNKKCLKQWFHMECLKKMVQEQNGINNNNNKDEVEQNIPKTDDDWFCDECLKDESSIQKRCTKHRKFLQKQRNIAHFKNIGREDIIVQKMSKKKSSKKGSNSSLNMLNSAIFGSENSINILKSENSNKGNDLLFSTNSLKKIAEPKIFSSGQKIIKSQEKKQFPISPDNSNNNKQQSPETKSSMPKENSESKLEGILNKYLNEACDSNKIEQNQSKKSPVQIPTKSPQQKQLNSQQIIKDSPQSQKNEIIQKEESINQIKFQQIETKESEKVEKNNNSTIESVQDPFNSSNKKSPINVKSENDSQIQGIKLNMNEIDDVKILIEQESIDKFPLKYHQSVIFNCCQVDQNKKKSRRAKTENNIVAFVRNNPFEIELYNLDKSKLSSIYYHQSIPETSFNFVQHILYKGSSYLVFSHDSTMSIFSVQNRNVWKMSQKIDKDQPFYLSSNDTYIQIFTKGNKPNELKCINVQIFDQTITIKEDVIQLDIDCQNFQQLCFYKDQSEQTSFMFLSEDRMQIYLYPDLDPESIKPVISIDSDFPLQQMHVIDPEDKRYVLMDKNKQILIYENNGFQVQENTCAYASNNKYQCIKYYVQPKKNILLQLYEEQIHLSTLDSQNRQSKAISFAKPFIDAIYKELETQIVVFYIEKDENDKKQMLSYFIIDK